MEDGLAAESGRPKIGFVGPNPAVSADPAILPHARHEIGVFGLNACDGFAAGAHQREERFDAVDAVKEHVGRALLIRARPPGSSARNRPELFIFQQLLNTWSKSQR